MTAGPADLIRDDVAWDSFVASSSMPSHLQTTAWAAIKRPNGWDAFRVAAPSENGIVGAQVLVQRAWPLPYGIGYVPRGPVGQDRVQTLPAFTERIRRAAKARRLGYVRIEPEAQASAGLQAGLREQGWQPAPHIQPESTRIIDIGRPEDEVWAGIHRKARQSISKSERLGVRVVEAGGSRLGEFYRIHTDAMVRAGIAPRAQRTYQDMWEQLAPRGMARLLFAETTDTGEPVATLFLVSCGRRVVDLYGGTTTEGGRRRANYLLKWEAIKRSRAWGFTEYDLWGLPREGIAQFKSSFGGREIHYVGAWDLVVDRVGRALLDTGMAARDRYRRWRYRDVHRPDADDSA